MTDDTRLTGTVQRKVFARKFAIGLLRPCSGMNPSVRLGEIAQTVLSRWPIKVLRKKATATFCYLTIGGRIHWLMLRESLFSLYHTWSSLPLIKVVSDGSWSAEEFHSVFAWWPGEVEVLTRERVVAAVRAAGEEELAQYAVASPYGLKLAAIASQAREQPLLFVDADILWFKDPLPLLGDPASWAKPRGVSESSCYQRRDMALRYCPQVLEPPFVNGGILALKGEFLDQSLLRSMVREALADPRDGTFEQTIIATAVLKGAGLFPGKLSLVELDDVKKLRHRDMIKEGYYSRHYVNWMRHLLYRDALRLRWQALFKGN
jgi:hypothetical protein